MLIGHENRFTITALNNNTQQMAGQGKAGSHAMRVPYWKMDLGNIKTIYSTSHTGVRLVATRTDYCLLNIQLLLKITSWILQSLFSSPNQRLYISQTATDNSSHKIYITMCFI